MVAVKMLNYSRIIRHINAEEGVDDLVVAQFLCDGNDT